MSFAYKIRTYKISFVWQMVIVMPISRTKRKEEYKSSSQILCHAGSVTLYCSNGFFIP